MELAKPQKTKLGGPYGRSADHLLDELARIELLVKAQVIAWRRSAACAGPESSWGMVLISDDEVNRYLESQLRAPGELSDEVSKELLRAADRHRVGVEPLVADDLHLVVSIVDARLEELHALARELRALDASQELLSLAAEHRAADDLDASDASAPRARGASRRGERQRERQVLAVLPCRHGMLA